jgi:hypothetical protein
VVRDRDVFQASRLCGLSHLKNRRLAIGRCRVHVEVALDVVDRDEFRQLSGFSEAKFEAIFSQFRCDEWQSQCGVNFFLGTSRNVLVVAINAVFVDFQTLLNGTFTNDDIVLF